MDRLFEDLPIMPRPAYFNRPLKSAKELIATGADIMATYLDPEGGLTKDDVIERLLELFESPIAIEALEREIERRTGGRDVSSWQ